MVFLDKLDRLEVGARGRKGSSREEYRKLRKALCVGNANQVAERMLRHNGFRTLTFKPQLVQVLTSQTHFSVLYFLLSDNVRSYTNHHELSRSNKREDCKLYFWVLIPGASSICAEYRQGWYATKLCSVPRTDIHHTTVHAQCLFD